MHLFLQSPRTLVTHWKAEAKYGRLFAKLGCTPGVVLCPRDDRRRSTMAGREEGHVLHTASLYGARSARGATIALRKQWASTHETASSKRAAR